MTSSLIKSRHRHLQHPIATQPNTPTNFIPPFLKNLEHEKARSSSICKCNLCIDNYLAKQSSQPTFASNSIIATNLDKTNLEVILSSIVGRNKRKGLHVQIPQTCFYKAGKPEIMYFNTHDEVKVMNAKRFSNRQVLNEFLKRRKEAKQNFQQLIESNSRECEEIHEKYFEKLKPSYKHKINPEELEQKMYRVNRDARYEILQDKEQSHEQACITHFSDGATILVNQGQFKSIKNNPNQLKTLQYIQALIPCIETVVAQFNEFSTISHTELYNIARTDVQILLGEISAFNIKGTPMDQPEQYYNLLKATPSTFALYQTFKIIHYISKLTEIIIYSLKLNWAVTKQKHYYLIDIVSINYRQKDPREIKILLNNQMQLLRNRSSSQVQHIETMQEMMVARWRAVKKQKRINHFSEDIIIRSSSPKAKSHDVLSRSCAGKIPKLLPRISRKKSLCESQVF